LFLRVSSEIICVIVMGVFVVELMESLEQIYSEEQITEIVELMIEFLGILQFSQTTFTSS